MKKEICLQKQLFKKLVKEEINAFGLEETRLKK
jgi:hypothetical protein